MKRKELCYSNKGESDTKKTKQYIIKQLVSNNCLTIIFDNLQSKFASSCDCDH